MNPIWEEEVIFSTWPQVHTETRRPLRIKLGDTYQAISDLNAMSEKPGKVVLPDLLDWSGEPQTAKTYMPSSFHMLNEKLKFET